MATYSDLCFDGHKVLRGKCMVCNCLQFKRQESKFACFHCKHPPVKHVNLTTISSRRFSELHYDPSYDPRDDPTPVGHSIDNRHSYQLSSSADETTTSRVLIMSDQQHIKFPPCSAEGCTESVFNDRYVGLFKFCSPTCRDKTVLPEYDEKLRKDLKYFKISGDGTDMMLPLSPVVSSQKEIKVDTLKVEFKTKPKEESGFLFCKDEELNQVVITGADSPTAMELLKKGIVHLYDIVMKVMDTEIKDVAEIEILVKPKTIVDFYVRRHPNIRIDLSTFFKDAKHKKIVLLKYTSDMTKFGVRVERYDKKLGIDNDSIAYKSGLRNYEYLKYYAATNDTEVMEVLRAEIATQDNLNRDIGTCRGNKLHLLLAVDSEKL